LDNVIGPLARSIRLIFAKDVLFPQDWHIAFDKNPGPLGIVGNQGITDNQLFSWFQFYF
jgi:hypothetical protein